MGPFEINDMDAHFVGVYELPNGTLYQGGFLHGKRSGYGTQIWKNGSLYEGQWNEGKANGRGRMIFSDGDYYIGNWENDLRNDSSYQK